MWFESQAQVLYARCLIKFFLLIFCFMWRKREIQHHIETVFDLICWNWITAASHRIQHCFSQIQNNLFWFLFLSSIQSLFFLFSCLHFGPNPIPSPAPTSWPTQWTFPNYSCVSPPNLSSTFSRRVLFPRCLGPLPGRLSLYLLSNVLRWQCTLFINT